MKRIVIAGALLASAASLTGCGLASIGGPTEERVIDYDVTDKVASLSVRSESGDIVISETARTGIKVTETLQWRNKQPKATHAVQGDTLALTYDCEQSWDSCHVNYRIEVPKGLLVKTHTGSGDITLRQLSAIFEATTGSGDIEGSGLAGKKVTVDTGSGAVELKMTGAPDDVKLETGSGDVKLYLPKGPYDLDVRTGSGESQLDLTDTPGDPHRISLQSGSGDLSVLAG
ncbi:DUF4097 domain-containing protein [Nonomuraea sp. NBC_01738]|uniref:DUF4097 family beta strand repeat-containing protein n=1 Tax=Nonomuraea sp. NBC_01738 TaxID=2976003 RepID=UPI002E134AA0|nr:DUF4097 domain-containing protein [Nonomuraea sp. NBC_01738]